MQKVQGYKEYTMESCKVASCTKGVASHYINTSKATTLLRNLHAQRHHYKHIYGQMTTSSS